MSSELDCDGKGALLNTDARSAVNDRQKARRTCAHHALTTSQPHHVLAELLDQLDLNPQKGEPR